jgi:hypothetical protein
MSQEIEQVMKTELKEAMTAGVYVEFVDDVGRLVGEAVYTDWRGRPLPAVGDTLCSMVGRGPRSRARRVCGRVTARHFETQFEDDGSPCVWARLTVEAGIDSRLRAHSHLMTLPLSKN